MSTLTKLTNLDLGKFGSHLDLLAEGINIPYTYLPRVARQDPRVLVTKVIMPSLQEMSRRGEDPQVMREQIQGEKERMSAGKMSARDFISEVRRVYVRKINVQCQIAHLIKSLIEGRVLASEFAKTGVNLLAESGLVEPVFFAASGLMKKHASYCLSQMPSGLSLEEQMLVSSPAHPAFFVTYELDMREYLVSGKRRREELKRAFLRRYFNEETLYMGIVLAEYEGKMSYLVGSAKDRAKLLVDIAVVREDLKRKRHRKIYFAIERKIPLLEELDQILTFDDCFDPYFGVKCCFLHDLFLKVALMDMLAGRKVFKSFGDINEVERRLRLALLEPDEQLIKAVSRRGWD